MKMLRNLAISVVPAILGIFGTLWYNEHNERMRFLEESIAISRGIFSTIPIDGFRIITTDANRVIDNISLISVKLFNYSDKDFDNVPVYIDLIQKSNEPLEVLRADAKGAGGLSEAVEEIELQSSNGDRTRYGYNVKTLNRLEDREIFSATFVIAGDVYPDVSVKIDKKGLERREFSTSNIRDRSWISILLIIGMVLLTVGYIVLLVWWFRRERKLEPVRVKEIRCHISSSAKFSALKKSFATNPDALLEPLLDHVVRETRKRSIWLNTPRFLRSTYREEE